MIHRTFESDRRKLIDGLESVESIVEFFLARIEAENEQINAFVDVDPEALDTARQIDSELDRGVDLPLAGMVVAVKDVIARKGMSLSCASGMLDGFESLFSATAVERLEAKGAIVIGRTNCDEFAMGSSNENSFFGPVRNPHDISRVSGGSSGGSAAAVAAGMCHVALGSDTGGSVRQPAAFCGVVGLKPTYGRVSRSGLVAFASSLDCIGPMAHSVADAAMVLQHISGYDPNDATSSDEDVPNFVMNDATVNGIKVGLPIEYLSEELPESIRQVLTQSRSMLEEEGVEFDEVSIPSTSFGVATYYILACAEASSNLARYDGVRYGKRSAALPSRDEDIGDFYTRNRSAGFGAEVKRRLMLGTYVLSAGYYDKYYGRAQAARRLIRDDFDKVFESVDVLLAPVTPTPAYPLGSPRDSVLETYLEDIYTVTANLAGIPAIAVPMGKDSDGLPVAVQLLSRHFNEHQLFVLADYLMGESNN